MYQMLSPLIIDSQSDCLIQASDTNSNTEWQTVQIQIGWLLKKPTDLHQRCLQKRHQGLNSVSVLNLSCKTRNIQKSIM